MAGEGEECGGAVWVYDVRGKVLLFDMHHAHYGQVREVRMKEDRKSVV